MMFSVDPPTPILALTPELKEKLKTRNQNSLAQLLKKNSGSVFFRESVLLASLREAGNATPDDTGELGFVHRFYKFVPLSTYDDYHPFILRFSETPCHTTSVRDLFSLGLPDFLAQSSGTSGAFKLFPKYPHPRGSINPWNSLAVNKVKTCMISTLLYYRIVNILDDEAPEGVRQVPVSTVSTATARRALNIVLKDDAELMSKKSPFSVTPFACRFMGKHTSSIFIVMFFAVMDPTLQRLSALYSTVVSDAIRILETYWEVFIDAIEAGIVPDVYDFDQWRPYLEMYVRPNPGRATELRSIEKGKEGWLNEVWPALGVVMVVASGIFAALVPKLRHHFGSKVVLMSRHYASTECTVGWRYSASDLNLFKIDYFEHIEFIDIEAREKAEIFQAWELESGKKYEIVVTTHDGLWRYQLKDIIEVGGFDPTDGQPLVRFSGRSSVGFRISGECIPERMLQDAVSSLENNLGCVSEFTSAIDNRKVLPAYGFFLELDGELSVNGHEAPKVLKEYLLGDLGYKQYSTCGRIGQPTICIVAPGTFQAYRDWRIATTGTLIGQIKVPIMTLDDATKKWFSEHVVSELGV